MSILFFLPALFHLATISAAQPGWYNDSQFFLWCGGLTCKEIKREQVPNMTSQRFLNIPQETVSARLPDNSYFDNTTVIPGETIYIEDGIRDRRLMKRWRYLTNAEGKNMLADEKDEGLQLDHERMHVIVPSFHSCNDNTEHTHEKDPGIRIETYPNSIPYKDNFYCGAHICSDEAEHLWFKIDRFAWFKDAKSFPLYVLWVEHCKKPLMLHECKLSEKMNFIDVEQYAAIKCNGNNEFQIFYIDSIPDNIVREEPAPITIGTCTITIRKPEGYGEQKVPMLATFALDRVQKHRDKIGHELLNRWYALFMKIKTGEELRMQEFKNVKEEMNAVVDACDRDVV